DELVAELTAGARRCSIEEHIAQDLVKLSGGSVEQPGALLEKAGFLATNRINRFVSALGFDAVPEKDRPQAPAGPDGEMVTVFAERPVMSNCDDLSGDRRDFGYLALSQWMYGFNQMVVDNVLSGEGIVVNVEE